MSVKLTGNVKYNNITKIEDISNILLCLSLKKIISTYSGNCLRLRRSSDNAEEDFGFDSYGYVDMTSIASWGGVDTLYIRKWYDQTTYANNAEQTTNGEQPTWDNTNTKIVFDHANTTELNIAHSASLDVNGGDFSLLMSASFDGYFNSGSSINVPLIKGNESFAETSYGFILDNSNNIQLQTGQSSRTTVTPIGTGKRKNLIGIHEENVGGKVYFNNTQQATGGVTNPNNSNTDLMVIGTAFSSPTTRYIDMDLYSVMLWGKKLTSGELVTINGEL